MRSLARRRGAAKTEFIILVVLIAIGALWGVLRHGAILQNKYVGADAELVVELGTDPR